VRVWIVGSGTLRPDPLRGPPAYWIEEDATFALLDCGAGTLRTLARLGLPWQRVTHILLSHFHTDHVGELAPLLFALKHGLKEPRTGSLHVLGPPGLAEHLDFLSRAHGAYVTSPGFPLDVVELDPGSGWSRPPGGFGLRTRKTLHTETSLAMRLEFQAGSVGYTGDTGPDLDLGAFLEGCRLLIAECSHPDGSGTENHLTPSSLSQIARAAAPELLVPVHAYPPLDPAMLPDLLVGAGYRGEVRPGEDGLLVEFSEAGLVTKRPPPLV
jgi:ribonuclease BN (tRNA processing enzyme)